MATPKVSRSWAAVAAPRLTACLICCSVTALHTHTYISMRTPHVSSDKNNRANKNHLQQFFEKNICGKSMSYKNAAKKFAPATPDGGQIGRDLPLRGRGVGVGGAARERTRTRVLSGRTPAAFGDCLRGGLNSLFLSLVHDLLELRPQLYRRGLELLPPRDLCCAPKLLQHFSIRYPILIMPHQSS